MSPKGKAKETYRLYCLIYWETENPTICCDLYCNLDFLFSEKRSLKEEEIKNHHDTFYLALKKGMEKAYFLGVNKIECVGNDSFVLSQINGETELEIRYYEITFWENQFEEVTFRYLNPVFEK